ncbi:MAG: YbjN domain-containing protein [Acidimicrobiaceae bacterium]|nr:YbjN domain-containing protein [Acidimicrobiaceae bacterium]
MDAKAMAPADLDALQSRVDAWLSAAARDNPSIVAVERGHPDEQRWYVRIHGESKQAWTIWFTLRQRTLCYETQLTPPPQENAACFYEHLLRRNRQLTGLKLEIGPEDAVFLSGAAAASQLTAEVMDGILGAMYAATELIFAPAMRIGYASAFQQ